MNNFIAKNHQKVIVVLPAYNAEKTIAKTYSEIPKNVVDEIIMVDDFSSDKTVKIAKKLKIKIYLHKKNKGYGANQKMCYDHALSMGGDIIVMLHPDYQYDPKLIKYLVEYIKNGYFDVMLGTRIRTMKEAIEGGMPKYKYYSNRFLTAIENLVTGQNLGEWHTGMRAYRREVLESIEFKKLSNDFIFDTQALFRIIKKGYRIGEIPVPIKYFPEASSINFKRSLKYGVCTLAESFKYLFYNLFK